MSGLIERAMRKIAADPNKRKYLSTREMLSNVAGQSVPLAVTGAAPLAGIPLAGLAGLGNIAGLVHGVTAPINKDNFEQELKNLNDYSAGSFLPGVGFSRALRRARLRQLAAQLGRVKDTY